VFDGMSDFGVRPCVDDARGGVLANGRCGRGRCWFVQDNVRQKKNFRFLEEPLLVSPRDVPHAVVRGQELDRGAAVFRDVDEQWAFVLVIVRHRGRA
jgi:hypothetical protein